MENEAGVLKKAWERGETRRAIFATALWPKVTMSAGIAGGQVSCYKRCIVLSIPSAGDMNLGARLQVGGKGECGRLPGNPSAVKPEHGSLSSQRGREGSICYAAL